MKKYLSEENKLKITIRKDYLERENIKTKILNNINRLTHLCLGTIIKTVVIVHIPMHIYNIYIYIYIYTFCF